MTFIDVSRWQGVIDWPRVKAAGVTCAIIRLATGTRIDDAFRRNWDGARVAGIPRRGVYQYYITETDPLLQVDAALELTGGDIGTEPFTVDVELREDQRGQPFDRSSFTVNLRAYLIELGGAFPLRIYTSRPEWHAMMTRPAWIAEYDLWLAAYPGPPALPDGATAYTVHQYSRTGHVDGIAGDVDLNREVSPPPEPEPVVDLARIAALADDMANMAALNIAEAV